MRGNCYVTSEALYHLLGGKESGYTPQVLRIGAGTHWFLRHRNGTILDATAKQFDRIPDYNRARGTGFLTRLPSKRARVLMDKMLWNERQ